MKDTIVTARRKKIELITLLVCFVVSNLLHLYAIIAYQENSLSENVPRATVRHCCWKLSLKPS